ncbi:Pyranose dehydrogenase 3 [Psilocybe cubensis]|uniref:pyranose dehydrogenase (acceptor) n=2 Tax=Psilocybe cubensis TaxID=181762 RepID=A0A8H7XZV0_PSICU|nr:Pyranose dehydrogenase 3 [Psilocybe cubensis]KAH9481209.1 Pyranose dehydrogenase 3 [Psilocybe cubensis]
MADFLRTWLSIGLVGLVFYVVLPARAVLITLPLQLNTTFYDYVIVGGGTAGLTLASRLTENASTTVIVLEAGISDQHFPNLQIPFIAPTLSPKTQVDWNTTTTAQPGLNNREIPYIRGHVLGGSSSINYLFHQYCSSDDWDRLSSISGDINWEWTRMAKYHENLVASADFHNTIGQFDGSDHSKTGQVPISLPGSNQSIDTRVLATTQQLAEFPFNLDTGGGDHSLLGVGFLISSAGNGTRSSSSTTYLNSSVINRPNLVVLVNVTATMLFQSGNSTNGLPSFRSLHYTATPPPGNLTLGTIQRVTATKEIILSAGAIGTPQLLMLSGIGDSAALARLQINTTINNPSVGANLSDHMLIPNVFAVNGTGTLDDLLRNATTQASTLNQWKTTKKGSFANSVSNTYGFTRFPANSSIFNTTPDPSAGPNTPHWEIILSNFFFQPGTAMPSTGNFLTVVTVPSTPTSRGSVTLRSNNPYDQPIVDPQYLTTAFDMSAAVESVKGALRFISAPAWSGYVVGNFSNVLKTATSDALIEQYIRGIAGSAFHGVGTAAMSSSNATTGVVNSDLTLKGVDGVRIVDSSVFPFIPSCHTQGPVYLLAERAADIIKAANN